jgi:hypothetical protein
MSSNPMTPLPEKGPQMENVFVLRPNSRASVMVGSMVRVLILMLPTALLIGLSLRTSGPNALMLWIGTGFQATVCLLSFFSRRSWNQSIAPSIITLYVIALFWIWWGQLDNDWFTNFAKALLLVVPLLVFAHHTLNESGAPAIRRARVLAERLASRKEWPGDISSIRGLPEVKALRAALQIDASPALALLSHKRPEVRVAALLALEFRKDWKPGQAELVLQTALRAEQPMLRAASVYALANVDDRELVERVAEFLHDSAVEVRRCAVESLLWDTENRWGWIRYQVRRVLAEPLFQHDGPLWHDGQLLTREAINDLTAWTAEKGVLAVRAAITLGAYFNRALSERNDPALLKSLREKLSSRNTAAILRIELGRVLQHHQEFDPVLLMGLLDSSNPTPLRMIAIESVLSEQTDGALYEAAVVALRELARLPNREIALATAGVIQRRLGVDLGLGLGQPLPPIHSRQAAEITRRVMIWATENDADDDLDDSRPIVSRRA